MRDQASSSSEQDIGEIFACVGEVVPMLIIGVCSPIADRTGEAGFGD
jgi:hypothetical protein